jgi:hypothetical protein
LGAIALSSLTFASTSEVKSEIEVKTEISDHIQESTIEQKLAFFKAWYMVPIQTPCGPVNVYFASNHADGTAEFIGDLAYAVNYSYDHCMPQGVEFN